MSNFRSLFTKRSIQTNEASKVEKELLIEGNSRSFFETKLDCPRTRSSLPSVNYVTFSGTEEEWLLARKYSSSMPRYSESMRNKLHREKRAM